MPDYQSLAQQFAQQQAVSNLDTWERVERKKMADEYDHLSRQYHRLDEAMTNMTNAVAVASALILLGLSCLYVAWGP